MKRECGDNLLVESEYSNLEFIWGISSWYSFINREASLSTVNDIEIVYDPEKKLYSLGIETAYHFEDIVEECDYLSFLLDAFTKFMLENGHSTYYRRPLFLGSYTIDEWVGSIEELYFNFKLFVNGHRSFMEEADSREVKV